MRKDEIIAELMNLNRELEQRMENAGLRHETFYAGEASGYGSASLLLDDLIRRVRE